MTVPRIWDRKDLTQRTLRDIQNSSGIPAQLVESVIWGMDTLDALKKEEWLVFKGGTCLQSYLPHGMQRASVDLDFNSRIENPLSIMDKVEDLNLSLREDERAVSIRGFEFGSLVMYFDDRVSGTLNLGRRMPSRLGEKENIEGSSVQSKSVRVQINHHHAHLPALEVERRPVDLFVNSFIEPNSKVIFPHSSKGDLLADKILATANVGGFGRERFKDVYDIGALLRCDPDLGITIEKLRLIADRSNLKVEEILNGSRRTVLGFQTRDTESRGFASMVSKAGRELISDWEPFCLSVSDGLEGILSRL